MNSQSVDLLNPEKNIGLDIPVLIIYHDTYFMPPPTFFYQVENFSGGSQISLFTHVT